MSFNYDQLDDGVRELVRLLRDNRFTTTDSGDGYSKPEAQVSTLDRQPVSLVKSSPRHCFRG